MSVFISTQVILGQTLFLTEQSLYFYLTSRNKDSECYLRVLFGKVGYTKLFGKTEGCGCQQLIYVTAWQSSVITGNLTPAESPAPVSSVTA